MRRKEASPPDFVDEPGVAERFKRALRKALDTPSKHRTARTPRAKEQPASNGRVHKGKARNYFAYQHSDSKQTESTNKHSSKRNRIHTLRHQVKAFLFGASGHF